LRYFLRATVFLDSRPPARDYELRQKIDNREQGQMPFPRKTIQDAYNSAVIAGDYTLAERYAACWLWLLMAEKEQAAQRISRRTLVTLPRVRQSPSISGTRMTTANPPKAGITAA
jgi:hypothetical protein